MLACQAVTGTAAGDVNEALFRLLGTLDPNLEADEINGLLAAFAARTGATDFSAMSDPVGAFPDALQSEDGETLFSESSTTLLTEG